MNFPSECQADLPKAESSTLLKETIESDLHDDTRPLVHYNEPPPPYCALPSSEWAAITQQPGPCHLPCPQPRRSQIISVPHDRGIRTVSLSVGTI